MHSSSTSDVKGMEDQRIRYGDIKHEPEDVLVILCTLQPDMVTPSKLVTMVDSPHVHIVQCNTDGAVYIDPAAVFLRPLDRGVLSRIC